MLVKTAKKLCDNVLALLAKKPEHVEEQKTKENETIISQTDKTKSNNETTRHVKTNHPASPRLH